MKNLKHEHLVRLNHFFEDRENIYLLMDLCSHQSLHDLVQRRGYLTEVEVRYFMKQFVEGVGCMQKNNVMHRDLKIGNTFIDEQMRVKIGDFGLSRIIGPTLGLSGGWDDAPWPY